MIIPNFPTSETWVDKEGRPTVEFHKTLASLFTVLQSNLSDEGIFVPQQSTTNIAVLNNALSTGALVYDSTTHELKVNINGTFKVVQVV